MTVSVWLGIARLRRSELVLLDEPMSQLSLSEATHIAHLLRELATHGPAVLIATSDQRLAEETGDSVHELEDGQLKSNSFQHLS